MLVKSPRDKYLYCSLTLMGALKNSCKILVKWPHIWQKESSLRGEKYPPPMVKNASSPW